jgi:hypothetical protein
MCYSELQHYCTCKSFFDFLCPRRHPLPTFVKAGRVYHPSAGRLSARELEGAAFMWATETAKTLETWICGIGKKPSAST